MMTLWLKGASGVYCKAKSSGPVPVASIRSAQQHWNFVSLSNQAFSFTFTLPLPHVNLGDDLVR